MIARRTTNLGRCRPVDNVDDAQLIHQLDTFDLPTRLWPIGWHETLTTPTERNGQ